MRGYGATPSEHLASKARQATAFAKQTPQSFKDAGVKMSNPGTLSRSASNVLRGKSVATGNMSANWQVKIVRLNKRAYAGSITPEEYTTQTGHASAELQGRKRQQSQRFAKIATVQGRSDRINQSTQRKIAVKNNVILGSIGGNRISNVSMRNSSSSSIPERPQTMSEQELKQNFNPSPNLAEKRQSNSLKDVDVIYDFLNQYKSTTRPNREILVGIVEESGIPLTDEGRKLINEYTANRGYFTYKRQSTYTDKNTGDSFDAKSGTVSGSGGVEIATALGFSFIGSPKPESINPDKNDFGNFLTAQSITPPLSNIERLVKYADQVDSGEKPKPDPFTLESVQYYYS